MGVTCYKHAMTGDIPQNIQLQAQVTLAYIAAVVM
jgi:hypothetical protein